MNRDYENASQKINGEIKNGKEIRTCYLIGHRRDTKTNGIGKELTET